MKNSIVVTIPFDYKGKHLTPSVTIDLDDFVENDKGIANIYSLIAAQNSIGLYTYEYEVLMSSKMNFSDPHGSAAQFLNGTDFDLEKFKGNYQQQKLIQALQSIAQEHLQIDNLQQNPDLMQALLAAYKFGEKLAK